MIRIKGSLIGKSLVLDLEADQPLAALLDSGNWGPTVRRRTIPVPYFSGRVDYLPAEGLFVAANYDWTVSAATSLDGSRASYLALTDGRRNPIRERIVFSAAWHLDEVLPNIPNRPSPFLGDLADRIVLDIWGGRYTEIAHHFEILSGYGINRCVAIVHDWQRSGYDNALPMHLPAASDKGGDPGMKTLVATAKRLGYVVALHENYVDYYPNYDHFREADIALDSAGKRQNAWYNPGTKIQSFAVAPTAILALAATQSAEIHRRYGTNACYLDVHSAVPPWFHVDERAARGEQGRFAQSGRSIASSGTTSEQRTMGRSSARETITGTGAAAWTASRPSSVPAGPARRDAKHPFWSISTCSRSIRYSSIMAWVITSAGGVSPRGEQSRRWLFSTSIGCRRSPSAMLVFWAPRPGRSSPWPGSSTIY